jgi:hypothetical protein
MKVAGSQEIFRILWWHSFFGSGDFGDALFATSFSLSWILSLRRAVFLVLAIGVDLLLYTLVACLVFWLGSFLKQVLFNVDFAAGHFLQLCFQMTRVGDMWFRCY